MIALMLLTLAACDNRPPAPTAEENRQLDEAESMLNDEAQEKGPVSEDSDPDSNSD